MFQLTSAEWEVLEPQVKMREKTEYSSRSQIVTLKVGRGHNLKYLPYAFTEQGVAMLSSVLHSNTAVQMNIAIMRAFVQMRRLSIREADLQLMLHEVRDRIGQHDSQLNSIFEALENLLDEKATKRKWDSRERIGFKR